MEAAAAEVSGTLGRAYVGMREAAQAQAIDAAGAEAGSGKDKWRAAERCLSDKVVPHITKCFGELYAGGAKLVRVTASGS